MASHSARKSKATKAARPRDDDDWEGEWGDRRIRQAIDEPRHRRTELLKLGERSQVSKGHVRRSTLVAHLRVCEHLFDSFLERAPPAQTAWALLNALMHDDVIGAASAYTVLGDSVADRPSDALLLPVVQARTNSVVNTMLRAGGMWTLLRRVLETETLARHLSLRTLVEGVWYLIATTKLGGTDHLREDCPVDPVHSDASAGNLVPAVEGLFALLRKRLRFDSPVDPVHSNSVRLAFAYRRLLNLQPWDAAGNLEAIYQGMSSTEVVQAVHKELQTQLLDPHFEHDAGSDRRVYIGFPLNGDPDRDQAGAHLQGVRCALGRSLFLVLGTAHGSKWLLDMALALIDWPIEVLAVAVHESMCTFSAVGGLEEDNDLSLFAASVVEHLLEPRRKSATERWCRSASEHTASYAIMRAEGVSRVVRNANLDMTFDGMHKRSSLSTREGWNAEEHAWIHRLHGGRINVLLGSWHGEDGKRLPPAFARAYERLLRELPWPGEQLELLLRELLEARAVDIDWMWPLIIKALELIDDTGDDTGNVWEGSCFGGNWESQHVLVLAFEWERDRALAMLNDSAFFTPRAHHQLLAKAIFEHDVERACSIVEIMRARGVAMPTRWPGAHRHDFSDQLRPQDWNDFTKGRHEVDPAVPWSFWASHPVIAAQVEDHDCGVDKLAPLTPPRPELDAFLPCVVKYCPRALPALLEGDDYGPKQRELALITALGFCMGSALEHGGSKATAGRIKNKVADRMDLIRMRPGAEGEGRGVCLRELQASFGDAFRAEFDSACNADEWQGLFVAAEILMSPPHKVALSAEDPFQPDADEFFVGNSRLASPLHEQLFDQLEARLVDGLPFLAAGGCERHGHAFPWPMEYDEDYDDPPRVASPESAWKSRAAMTYPALYEPREPAQVWFAWWRTRKFAELVAERVWAPDGEAGAALRAEQTGSGRWARSTFRRGRVLCRRPW